MNIDGSDARIDDAIGRSDERAAHQLLPLIYEELRRVASARMASESSGHTLQATALVHEAWMRLTTYDKRQWKDRTHFFAASAEAMRHILVDNARRKLAVRHGGKLNRVEMPEIVSPTGAEDDQIVAVHEALEKFAAQDKQKAELVKLRYFVGMTIEEAAGVLGISEPTAKRHWAYARAWLANAIKANE